MPPFVGPLASVANGPPALLVTGGVKIGPSLNREAIATPCSLSAGVKSRMSSSVTPLREYAAGRLGNGCVGEYHSPATSPGSTGFSSIGQMGFPVTRSNTYKNPCFDGTATLLTGAPFRVKSARMGAADKSKSQMGWCTIWKYHLRTPVLRSRHTMLSPYKLLPGRCPP